MRRFFSWFVLIVPLLVGFPSPLFANATMLNAPKLANPYFEWNILEQNIPMLAKWDMVVVDVDQAVAHPERLRELRRLNPNVKLFAYIASEELADAKFLEPLSYPAGRLASRIDPSWFLRDPQGNKVYFWPGSAMLDVTSGWSHELSSFIATEISSSDLWDGVFLDNTTDKVTNFAKSSIDMDHDGSADDPAVANKKWKTAMTTMIQEIHQRSPRLLIMGNGGDPFASDLNGVLFEHFPSWNWGANFSGVRQTVLANKTPMMTAINVNTDNQDRPTDYRLMRFGLASAIASGAYYSFDRGDWHHDTLWWYDEYDVPIGEARGIAKAIGKTDARGNGVWMRETTNGVVLVNATNAPIHIPLSGLFQKVRGAQDPSVNSGEFVTAVDLPSRDGILLLRRSDPQDLFQTTYPNGAFVRALNQKDQAITSFVASVPDLPSSALTASGDVTGDYVDDLVWEDRGSLHVRNGATAKESSFVPFSGYKGKISFVIGNADRTNANEIIASPETNGPPAVRVFRVDGTTVAGWFAYRPEFRGGVRVAMGDVDGDGLREIVTIPGPGGGSHVRIWKTNGIESRGGWFAFDPSDTSGSFIAIGKINPLEPDRLVVFNGNGKRLRVFSSDGHLSHEVMVTDSRAGDRVGIVDVNRDGATELLRFGTP